MNPLRNAISTILKGDPRVLSLVGYDSDGSPKVYEREAKKDAPAPFIVWTIIGGLTPLGQFGDLSSIESRDVQISSWGRTDEEAWTIHAAAREALEEGEFDVELTPYVKLHVRRLGDDLVLHDPDVRYTQVPATFRFSLAR